MAVNSVAVQLISADCVHQFIAIIRPIWRRAIEKHDECASNTNSAIDFNGEALTAVQF